jgi:hypothetical protein
VSPHDGDVPFEDDPTGMRALLSGLPDPGPMPDDLVARIQASLLSESRSRAADAQTPHAIPQPPVAPNRHGASIPASRKRPARTVDFRPGCCGGGRGGRRLCAPRGRRRE